MHQCGYRRCCIVSTCGDKNGYCCMCAVYTDELLHACGVHSLNCYMRVAYTVNFVLELREYSDTDTVLHWNLVILGCSLSSLPDCSRSSREFSYSVAICPQCILYTCTYIYIFFSVINIWRNFIIKQCWYWYVYLPRNVR